MRRGDGEASGGCIAVNGQGQQGQPRREGGGGHPTPTGPEGQTGRNQKQGEQRNQHLLANGNSSRIEQTGGNGACRVAAV